jgi:hypothetical protein
MNADIPVDRGLGHRGGQAGYGGDRRVNGGFGRQQFVGDGVGGNAAGGGIHLWRFDNGGVNEVESRHGGKSFGFAPTGRD